MKENKNQLNLILFAPSELIQVKGYMPIASS